MKKIVLISAVFLFLGGCGLYRVDTPRGLEYMSLDEALAQVGLYNSFWDECFYDDLESLRKQATSEEDKAIIDQEIAENRQRRDAYAERQMEEKEAQEEQERLERERVERERIEFETKRKELIQNSDGTLKNKSAQQVKKLVDRWKEGWWHHKEYPKLFSIETFYKVFGKPEKKQFLSSGNERSRWQSYYNFLYNCKDGVVQIQISAWQLNDNAIVIVEDLNIF